VDYTEVVTTSVPERYLASAFVNALKRRCVVDATCDALEVDDVRLHLDDGTNILIDAELDTAPESLALAEMLGRPPWPRLRVHIGGCELWSV
jgi:hypothetical protein